jgi:hypothetical protein
MSEEKMQNDPFFLALCSSAATKSLWVEILNNFDSVLDKLDPQKTSELTPDDTAILNDIRTKMIIFERWARHYATPHGFTLPGLLHNFGFADRQPLQEIQS